MPAAQPRMQVTPSETASRLLRELSELSGKPPATLTRELLDEAVPALEMMLMAMRDMKKRPEQVRAAMDRLSNTVIRDLSQAQLDLDSAMKKPPGRKPGKGREAANTG